MVSCMRSKVSVSIEDIGLSLGTAPFAFAQSLE